MGVKAQKKEKVQSRMCEARIAKNMTQRELAEKTGLHRNTIIRIENGKRMPNWATCQRIAEALESSVGDLFG